MSTDPRPGMIRFNGAAKAYPVTVCDSCDMVLPHESSEKQLAWALEHQRTGHRVKFAVDVRPDPTQPFAFVTRETLQHHQEVQSGSGGAGGWMPPWQRPTWTAGKATLTQVGGGGGGSGEEPKKMTARERRRQRRKSMPRKDDT